MTVRFLWGLLWGLLLAPTIRAQTSSMTVLGNPSMTIDSPAEYANGLTITHNTLRLSVNANLTYNLQVRAATPNLTFGTRAIPVSQLRMRVTNVPGANAGVTLSTAYQSLGSARTTTAVTNLTVTIEYRLAGGQNLLQPAGAYTTTLNFLLTAQ